MPSRARVAALFAAGVVGISFAALFVRWALPAPPVVTGFYRMAISTGLLLAWCSGRLPRGRPLALALAAGVCFGADLALWHTAIVRTSLANATFLVNTTPLYIGLAALAAGERPGRGFAAGAGLALVGTALLVGVDFGDAAVGDLLALAAAFFYSGYLLLMKAVRRGTRSVEALAAAGLGSTAALLATALVRGDPLLGFPASSWLAFAGAALLAQLGGVLGIVWSLRYLRASFASVALLGQTLGTALLAWLLLGESLSPAQALGGAAVVAGIAFASAAARESPPTLRSHPSST